MSVNFASIPDLDAAAQLRRFGLRADRRLGQNFMQDAGSLEKIVRAAEVLPSDTVLEIGPGLGSLTRYLAVSARQVVAVELDRDLFPPLEAALAPYPNVRLVQGDILKVEPGELVEQPGYLVVANIPYYITSAIIRHLLDTPDPTAAGPRPRRVVLTIQKEVAERICAGAGEMSLLALSVQVWETEAGGPHPGRRVLPLPQGRLVDPRDRCPPGAAHSGAAPGPVLPVDQGRVQPETKDVAQLAVRRPADESPGCGALLVRAGLDPRRRAETLDLDEWRTLSAAYTTPG
jgi:16S rRNA (adenine1518-N6/adenine1519-N6)-dimethyltransferase